jgi:hypothetical protein
VELKKGFLLKNHSGYRGSFIVDRLSLIVYRGSFIVDRLSFIVDRLSWIVIVDRHRGSLIVDPGSPESAEVFCEGGRPEKR